MIERRNNKWLQYKIIWVEHLSNRKWYSAKNFDHVKEIIVDYHARYLNKLESHSILITVIRNILHNHLLIDVKALIKEILNKMKRKLIIKQTSIVINTLASIEIILSSNQTIQRFQTWSDFFNRKQKSFQKRKNNVTNSCQSRDMIKRESLSEEEY